MLPAGPFTGTGSDNISEGGQVDLVARSTLMAPIRHIRMGGRDNWIAPVVPWAR